MFCKQLSQYGVIGCDRKRNQAVIEIVIEIVYFINYENITLCKHVDFILMIEQLMTLLIVVTVTFNLAFKRHNSTLKFPR